MSVEVAWKDKAQNETMVTSIVWTKERLVYFHTGLYFE